MRPELDASIIETTTYHIPVSKSSDPIRHTLMSSVFGNDRFEAVESHDLTTTIARSDVEAFLVHL